MIFYCPPHLDEICNYIKKISSESAEARNGSLSSVIIIQLANKAWGAKILLPLCSRKLTRLFY